MDRGASVGNLHVVCFEEAGECTLERIAREAQPGDRVAALGPERFARRLRALGLPESVALESVGRAAGRPFDRLPAPGGPQPGAIAYGPRARALTPGARMAAVPDALPVAAPWTPERRARVRRELGLSAGEFAVLVCGDPVSWIDISFASRACTMARVGGAPVRLVASPDTARIAAASEFFETTAHGRPIVVDPRADKPWELLPALDAAVLDADGVGDRPVDCAGWRRGPGLVPEPMSALPALWSIAFGRPAAVHASIELGAHAAHPLVGRFDDDVASFARVIHAFATSASAASR